MRAHADGEPECEHRRPEPPPRDDGSETSADDDVGEVPGGVRGVQQRDVVPPAPTLERVPRGSGGRSAHAFRPHMTTPPPRLSLRTSTPLDARVAPEPRAAGPSGTPPSTSGSSRRGSHRPRSSRAGGRVPRAGGRRGRRAPRRVARGRPARRTRERRRFRRPGRPVPARGASLPDPRRSAGDR